MMQDQKDTLRFAFALLALAALGQAQTRVDLPTQSRRVDFATSTSTRPVKTGTAAPGTCAVGELFYDTDAAAGSNLLGCTSTNTWTLLGGSAPVASVFGRTGAVTPLSGDYTAAQVINAAATNAANVFAAGSKQTFQSNATTAGGRVACASLPTAPAQGDLACDSADSNRLKIFDGTAWQSMAGGSGITSLSQAGDLKIARDSATQATAGANCSSSTPCNVRVGDVTYTYTDGLIASNPSGTGTVRFGVDAAGVRTVWHNLTGLTCTGGTCAAGVNAFPSNSVQIAQCPVTSGAFDAAGCIDLRSAYGRDPYTAGTGLVRTGSQFAVNTATVPTYLTATATIDFPSIGAGACADSAVTLTGAATGDSVAAGWPAAIENGVTGMMFVTAADSLQVRLCNVTLAAINPASGVFRATVVRSF